MYNNYTFALALSTEFTNSLKLRETPLISGVASCVIIPLYYFSSLNANRLLGDGSIQELRMREAYLDETNLNLSGRIIKERTLSKNLLALTRNCSKIRSLLL